MKIAAVAAVAALTLTACGSGETFTMTSDEGIAKIKELITTNVDTSKYKIYEVEWNEDGHDRKLENILTQIDVYYIDAENNDYNLSAPAHGRKVHDRRSEEKLTVGPIPTNARRRSTSTLSTSNTSRRLPKGPFRSCSPTRKGSVSL